jgi:Maltokinase N-terminal cap domain
VANLVPSFKEFLPPWVAVQPWYEGTGVPTLTPVGFIRIEDPDGEVGMESHLVSDGRARYHLPMTYRGRPLADGTGLITTAQHSVLGPRWIYDAEHDPVWVTAVLRLVATRSATLPQVPGGPVAVGVAYTEVPPSAGIQVRRVLTPGPNPADPGTVGVMTSDHGCLAVVRAGL